MEQRKQLKALESILNKEFGNSINYLCPLLSKNRQVSSDVGEENEEPDKNNNYDSTINVKYLYFHNNSLRRKRMSSPYFLWKQTFSLYSKLSQSSHTLSLLSFFQQTLPPSCF